MADMFENALRKKYRFESSKGMVGLEQLWELPLKHPREANLNEIARHYFKQLKNGDDVDFVDTDKKSDETIQAKFDIVKYVIDVRLAEAKAETDKQARAAKKQKLLSILQDKEDQGLKEMSADDIRKMINELSAA